MNDNVWGGQVEIIALSNELECPIRVLQAEHPNELRFGENHPIEKGWFR